MGTKALRKLLASELPRTVRELQALLGKLNFCSVFVPDYKRLVRPLTSLLSAKSDGRWGPEHTQALNTLVRLTAQRMAIGLMDYEAPANLHVDEDSQDCSGVLTQGQGDSYTIVAMVGRPLLAGEKVCARVERLLLVALWCLKRLARFTMFVDVTLVLPARSELLAVGAGDDLPLRV